MKMQEESKKIANQDLMNEAGVLSPGQQRLTGGPGAVSYGGYMDPSLYGGPASSIGGRLGYDPYMGGGGMMPSTKMMLLGYN